MIPSFFVCRFLYDLRLSFIFFSYGQTFGKKKASSKKKSVRLTCKTPFWTLSFFPPQDGNAFAFFSRNHTQEAGGAVRANVWHLLEETQCSVFLPHGAALCVCPTAKVMGVSKKRHPIDPYLWSRCLCSVGDEPPRKRERAARARDMTREVRTNPLFSASARKEKRKKKETTTL